MKNISKISIVNRVIVIAGFLLMSIGAISQPPPPPNDPSNPGGGPNAPVGAPIGSGTLLLIGLAAAYAGRKMYIHQSKEE
jgi:hypothetical protein